MKEYIKPVCEQISIEETSICSSSYIHETPDDGNVGSCGCDMSSPWHDQGCIGCECECR